ncbi:MAG: RimK family alpha-L-glutamate ligase [Bacillaceae bacterium]|nr:RimK family alpha-L-glutamate ligase [Bacillaceae bacterium]
MAKKQGWIVYNGNLNSEKFIEYAEWFQASAEKAGIETALIKNTELIVTIENGCSVIKGQYSGIKPDFVHFADKDIPLAIQLEKMGLLLYNSARSIDLCDSKIQMYQALADQNIPLPKTMIAPKVFTGLKVKDLSPYEQIARELGFPLVIKEAYGSFGQQVYLINNMDELLSKVKELGSIEYVFQQFIRSSYGRDIRLNVVGNRVVAAMKRTSETDFRANVSAGGKTEAYIPNEEEVELASKVAKIVGATFAGVDLLFGKKDEPIVCEINTNPHIKSIYDCTGINVADAMVEHIIKDLRGRDKNGD